MEVYLDNSATTKPCDLACEYMLKSIKNEYYNPSALYPAAMGVAEKISQCRNLIANKLDSKEKQVFFTGSGTEADNIAILGSFTNDKKGGKVLFTAVEHPAVKNTCLSLEKRGYEVCEIPVTSIGNIDLKALEQLITPDTRIICVMHVNNETGAIMQLKAVCELRDKLAPAAIIHVDGIQSFLRIPFSFKEFNIQSYALSAHKIHGPKGIAALVLQKNHRVHEIQYGGGQENGLRSGTENVPGIVGLMGAVKSYPETEKAYNKLYQLKLHMVEQIKSKIPTAVFLGPDITDKINGAPHILNVSFLPVRSDTMLNALADKQIYCSSGSACASSKQQLSPVLRAMNVSRTVAESALRFSFSVFNSEEELDIAVECIADNYNKLSKYFRR